MDICKQIIEVNMYKPFEPAVLFLGIYPVDILTWERNDIGTVFIAVCSQCQKIRHNLHRRLFKDTMIDGFCGILGSCKKE